MVAGVTLLPFTGEARAQAVWVGGTDSDYHTAPNWSPAVVPNSTITELLFGPAALNTTISTAAGSNAAALIFEAGAPSFVFNMGPAATGFGLHGAGIVNSSGLVQTINLHNAGLIMNNSASMDANVVLNMTGSSQIDFLDNSTGGLAAFNLNTDRGVLITGDNHAVSMGSLSGTGWRVQFSGHNQSLTIGGNNQSTSYSGALWETASASNASLIKVGTGTLTLSGSNYYTGGTTISGGVLSVSSNGHLGASSGAVTLNGGTLRATGTAFNSTSRSISLDALGGGMDINNAANNFTVTQGISGPGGLIKLGAGTLTLTGTNTYTGATTVSAGTLRVNGSTAFSSLTTVEAGATLGGSGTIGTTSVNPGGMLSAGNSPGTLTIAGGLTLNPGSASSFEFGAPGVVGGASNDLVNVTGNLSMGGVLLTPGAVSGYYRLFNVAGTTSGAFSAVPSGATVSTDIPNQVNLLVDQGGQRVQFWDGADHIGNGTVDGGSGTWTAANTNWTGAPGQAGINDRWRGEVGVFAGAAGTVTTAGPLSFQGLQFKTDGYHLAGDPLTMTGDAHGNAVASFINVDGGVTATIAAALTGTGTGLDKLGNGTLVLSGGNSYTGGTTIASGTLQLGSGGASGSILGDVSNAGVFAIDRSDTFTFAGAISGTGGFEQRGSGVTIFAGANTYTGATTVAAGTLRAGAANAFAAQSAHEVNVGATLDLAGHDQTVGSLTGGGIVQLGSGTLTTGDKNASTSFNGTIEGNGGLTKTGAGLFTLGGNNTYTGPTTVTSGTLSVNGSIAPSSLTTVNPGATLGGNGTVGNTLIDGGTLSPGNSIGALTIAGDLVMTAASTYMLEVSPANADFTRVTGTATLGGATVAAQFAPGLYVEKRYTILTADGGVSGTFAGPVNTNLPQNFKTVLAHDGNNAYLDLSLSFARDGLSRNQRNVSNALAIFFNHNRRIPLTFGALDAPGLSRASGEVATTASQAAFDAQSQFLNTLTEPFAAGGQGATSTSSASQPMAYAGARKPHDAFAALASNASPMQTFEQRWRIFGSAYGGNTRIGGNAALGSHDATSRVYGAMGGATYALSPATEAGFALGGGGTSFGLSDGLGSGRSEMFQAGVFAHHRFARSGYISGAFAYGWHDVTTDRVAPLTGERLHGAYKAGVLSGRLEAGWRIDTAWAGVTPYAAAQAISYRMPSYLEQGSGAADSFALGYAGRNVTATRSELGLRLDRTTAMGDMLLTWRGRAAWAHNFDTARNAAATFQALPGTGFLVNGAAMAPDAARLSAGAEVAWRNGLSLAANFEGEFSGNVTSYTGKGTLRYAW